jgi:hypothetical protein
MQGRVWKPLGDQLYRLGTTAFVADIAGRAESQSLVDELGVSYVYLGSHSGWLARFAFTDTLKPNALQVVNHFTAGASCGFTLWRLASHCSAGSCFAADG